MSYLLVGVVRESRFAGVRGSSNLAFAGYHRSSNTVFAGVGGSSDLAFAGCRRFSNIVLPVIMGPRISLLLVLLKMSVSPETSSNNGDVEKLLS